MKKHIIIFLLSISIVYPFLCFAQDEPQLVLPTGHTAPITSVAFSPDGKYILSSSGDTTVRLWETDTGREIRTFFPIAPWGVSSVAFSPDGDYIISGAGHVVEYQNLKIYSVKDGKESLNLKGHADMIFSVKFSPNGKYAVSGSRDSTIKLWSIDDQKEIRTFTGHNKSINSVCFSPDGNHVLSSSDDKTVRLWDVSSGKEVSSYSSFGNRSVFHSAVFSPDSKCILANFDRKGMILWSVLTGQKVRVFAGYTGEIYSVAFSHDGHYVAAGCQDGTVKLWEANTGRWICSFSKHNSKVNSIAFSPDGKFIVSGSDDCTLKLWEIKSGFEIRCFKGHISGIQSISCSPDGRYVIDNNMKLWSFANGKNVIDYQSAEDAVTVEFSNSGKYIASGHTNGALKLWDLNSAKEIRSFSGKLSGHRGSIRSISFSKDDRYILSGSEDKTLKLWDVATGGNIRSFLGHTNIVNSVSLSPDAKYAVSGSHDSTLRLWDIATGKELVKKIFSFKSPIEAITSLSFSDDGLSILFSSAFSIGLYNTSDLSEIKIFPNSNALWWATSASFSPDGNYVISGSGDKIPRLWDVNNGRWIYDFHGNTGWINTVSFSPDGKYIICGSWDGTKIWDVSARQLLLTRVYVDQNDWVVATPDGRFDGSTDGIKLLHYAKDNKSIPLDSLFDRFYTPNLVAQVISGKEIPNIPDIRQGIQMPPIVRISSPKEGQVLKEKDIEVVVEAADQGGGIEDIRLYHNDKRIGSDERGMKKASDKVQSKFTISLVNGINTLKATAFSRDRTESHPYEVKIRVDIAEATSDMYIVAVGINSYKNSNYNLKYCVPDAQVMISTIGEKGKSIFRNIHLQTVFDEQATSAGIESALSRIEQSARPEDVFVFYYSGHGVMSEEDSDFYFVPYDVTEIYGEGMLKDKGLSAKQLRDISQRIRATKQLLIIDSCQSGKIVETFTMRGISEEKAIAHLARSAGITVIAATQSEQFALEYREISHGIFTYALLQGMEGKADGSPKDNRITVSELSGYIQATIPELTEKYRGKPQYPNVYMRGQDFPIVMRK